MSDRTVEVDVLGHRIMCWPDRVTRCITCMCTIPAYAFSNGMDTSIDLVALHVSYLGDVEPVYVLAALAGDLKAGLKLMGEQA